MRNPSERNKPTIRMATVEDAAALCAIYNPEVIESTRTLDLVPRSLEEQAAWITERSGGLAVLVAEAQGPPEAVNATQHATGPVVGFASLSFYRDRPGYRTSVENSIYVAPTYQGQGVGTLLLAELVDLAATRGFHAMFARIVGPQAASVALHQRHGFQLVGIERQVARKFNRWHDVALMQRLL